MKQAHKEANAYRGKTIELYDKMGIVVGNDQSTDSFAKNGEELEEEDDTEPIIVPTPQGTQLFKLSINLEDIIEGIESSTQKWNANAAASLSARKHGKKVRGNKDVVEAIRIVASKLESLGQLIASKTHDKEATELFKLVFAVEGIEMELLDDAFSVLSEDHDMATAFKERPPVMQCRYIENIIREKHGFLWLATCFSMHLIQT